MPCKEESKKARKCAIRYLAYKDRSGNEITRYLKSKGCSEDVVNKTLTFLKDNSYINDPQFALQFGRSRIENKKVGKLRLERELKDKGFENQIIRGTLNSLYEEYDERKIAMSCAKKKLQSLLSKDIKKTRGRLARFLERKGFAADITYRVVTQLVPNIPNKDFGHSFSLTDKQYQKTTSPRIKD